MGTYYIILALYLIFLDGIDHQEKFLFYLLRGPGVAIILYFTIIFLLNSSNQKQKKIFFHSLTVVFCGSVLISSLVAILQALDIDLFWKLRDFSIGYVEKNDLVSHSIIERHRPVGLAVNSVELGYQAILAIALLHSKKTRIFYLYLIVILIGQAAAGNRSSILTIFIYLIFFRRELKLYVRVSTIIIISALILTLASERMYTIDDSALGKAYLIYFGILYFINNPMGSGITLLDFIEFRDAFSMYTIASSETIVTELQRYTPHNQFINTVVIYGVLGAAILALSILHLFLKKISVNNYWFDELYALRIGFFLYMINSMVHNAGIFVLEPLIWYFIPFYDKFLLEEKILVSKETV
ncbi:hypothetical protein OAP35_04230 [Planktomarina temperata]|nr:hypothetical protein [Planktomarina temperata]